MRPSRSCLAAFLVAVAFHGFTFARADAPAVCSQPAVLQATTVDALRRTRLACTDDAIGMLALVRINQWPRPQPPAHVLQPPAPDEETIATEADFYFNLEEAYLPDAGFDRLAAFVQSLNRSSRILSVEISGSADSTEVGAANVRSLGLRRAEHIRDYLLAAGLPAGQVSVLEAFPRRENTEEGRAQDRSVHVRATSRRSAVVAPAAAEVAAVAVPTLAVPQDAAGLLRQVEEATRYARSRLAVESPLEEDVRAYAAQLKQQLRERFRTELSADLQQVEGAAKILFEVDADGNVQQAWLAGSSGPHRLAAALQALVRQGRVDPLPAGLRKRADRVFASVLWEQPIDRSATRAARYERPVRPVYPMRARRWKQEGTVHVHVRVQDDGRPADVGIAQSSGHRDLDDAALEAVRQASFVPAGAEHQGPELLRVPITFRLEPAVKQD